MPCTNCQGDGSSGVKVFDVQYVYSSNCTDCNSQCNGQVTDARCVVYTGPNLNCSTINTNDSIEYALQKIDQMLCQTNGNYSTYNTHCLGIMTTEAEFVSAITDFSCKLQTKVDTFIGTTFPAYQTAVDTRFKAIEKPGIVCAAAGVVATDTLQQVLNKYCTRISASLNLGSVDWDKCYTVTTVPTTVEQAFQLVIDQICMTKSSGGGATLPVFNNVGSCLPTPGSADSLVDTVGKIKTRLCQSPTLDNSLLSSSCVTIPGTKTDLQTLLQNLLTKVDNLLRNMPTFSTDFTVTNVDNTAPCLGKLVDLATPLNTDRLVAVDTSDASPGTLMQKLQQGTGISITSSGGKAVIATSGVVSDHKVLAASTGVAAGYLSEKIDGGSSGGVNITPVYNTASDKVQLNPSVSLDVLVPAIRQYLETNAEEKAAWCKLFANCPSPCSPPTDVSAVYVSG